jgi:hypothetical protein
MAAPTTLEGKISLAYVNIANYVANEDPLTPNHDKHMRVAMQLAQGGQSVDWFVKTDLIMGQGFTDATLQSDIETRLVTLLLNLIKIGFGA